MSEKILIIGGSGLVGSVLANYALDNYDLHLTKNKNDIQISNIPVTQIDLIDDRKKIPELIKKLKPNYVVHTVAFANVDYCEENQEMANLLHVDITQDIANICNEINSKLIYISTDAVFDGKKDGKYDEEDIPNPISYYGETKLKAENIILQKSENNIVLRTTVIYGWNKKSRFTNWIINSMKNNQSVTAFTNQYNTPTLVDDLAKVILLLIQHNKTGLYHVVGPTCLSRYEFAKKLAQKFNLDTNLIKPTLTSEKPQIASRPENGCLNCSKLESELNFKFCSIDEGISFVHNQSIKCQL